MATRKPGARTRKASATRKKSGSGRGQRGQKETRHSDASRRKSQAKRSGNGALRERERVRSESPGNAITLLKQDHARVRSLYEDYETSGGLDKLNIAEKIMRELDGHAAAEERIFYRALRDNAGKDAQRLVRGAADEHREVKTAVQKLRDMDPEDEAFGRRFEDMFESICRHVDTEEREMFPLAEQVLGQQLDELGWEIRQFKDGISPKWAIAA